MHTRTLPGAEFLCLWLRHVLPKHFRRARNFGFLHPNSQRLIHLLHLRLNVELIDPTAWIRMRPTLSCPCCGAVMRTIRTRIPPPRPAQGYHATNAPAAASGM